MESGKPYAGLISVQLTVDRLRQQVMAILPDYADTIRASIEAEVDAAVKSFNWEKEVQYCIHGRLREIVTGAIRDSISDTLWRDDIKRMVDELVIHSLKKAFGAI